MSRESSKEALLSMATEEFRKEISGLIRSRAPLIYLVSTEEKRVLEFFRHYTKLSGYETHVWDCYGGLLEIVSGEPCGLLSGDHSDPVIVLDFIIKNATEEIESSVENEKKVKGNIYILLDFHRYLSPRCTPEVERRLRTLARMDSNSVVILVGPSYEVTPALDKDVRVLDFPLPNREELKLAMNTAISVAFGEGSLVQKNASKNEQEILNAVVGLTFPEACAAFGKSLVMHQKIDIQALLKEKQEVIRKTGVLQYIVPKISIDDIGGLSVLTDWLKDMRVLLHPDALEYGLPMPKGALLIGVPGSGKSLSAKAAAALFQIPLLRMDFGALFGQYMGESEKQARLAISVAEKVAPCVLWVDEIDKGLAGHASSGRSDSGTTARVISTFLTWMQEKESPVFFMCTANEQSSIPTEFLRAGRFDEIFFVDLPTRYERALIMEKLLIRKKRNPKDFHITEISVKSDGYTGAEMEKALDMALRKGFAENRRPITTVDIIQALSKFKPLSKVRPEAIEAMQVWAQQRCIKANSPEPVAGLNLGNKTLDVKEEIM